MQEFFQPEMPYERYYHNIEKFSCFDYMASCRLMATIKLARPV